MAGASQRGRANTAHSGRPAQGRVALERASVQARATIAESEVMPLPYAAELLGMGTDDEKAIRRLIALMVLGYDPIAIALTAAASARRSKTTIFLKPHLVRSTLDTCRADAIEAHSG
jgi:hypothetical protein